MLCHGRGGRAEDMLGLRRELDAPGVTFAAPEAAGSTWYPLSFIAPLEANEPHLSSALALLGAVVAELEDRGVPAERQLLLGFSQGGCLALEYAVRNARRYGAIVGLSAGLIGPPSTRWDFGGTWRARPCSWAAGTPTRTFRESAWRSPPGSSGNVGRRSTCGSTRVSATPSTATSSGPLGRCWRRCSARPTESRRRDGTRPPSASGPYFPVQAAGPAGAAPDQREVT